MNDRMATYLKSEPSLKQEALNFNWGRKSQNLHDDCGLEILTCTKGQCAITTTLFCRLRVAPQIWTKAFGR